MVEELDTTKEEFPLKRCQRDGSKGWKYGDDGYCYTRAEEGSDEQAKEKARKQGEAIEISRHKKKSSAQDDDVLGLVGQSTELGDGIFELRNE